MTTLMRKRLYMSFSKHTWTLIEIRPHLHHGHGPLFAHSLFFTGGKAFKKSLHLHTCNDISSAGSTRNVYIPAATTTPVQCVTSHAAPSRDEGSIGFDLPPSPTKRTPSAGSGWQRKQDSTC